MMLAGEAPPVPKTIVEDVKKVLVERDKVKPVIWDAYKKILKKSGEPFKTFDFIERFEFYERARKAYAIIATSEAAQYANIILKKGVVK